MWQSLAFLKGLDYTWPGHLSTVFKVSETAGGGLSFLSADCLMNLISDYPPVYASAVTEIVLGVFCLSTCMVVLYCYYPKEEDEVAENNNEATQSSRESSNMEAGATEPSFDALDRNHDNALNQSEYDAGRQERDPTFAEADTNCDGRVDRQEYKGALGFLEADTPDDLFTRRMIIAAVS
jgi:hypothetical protein